MPGGKPVIFHTIAAVCEVFWVFYGVGFGVYGLGSRVQVHGLGFGSRVGGNHAETYAKVQYHGARFLVKL